METNRFLQMAQPPAPAFVDDDDDEVISGYCGPMYIPPVTSMRQDEELPPPKVPYRPIEACYPPPGAAAQEEPISFTISENRVLSDGVIEMGSDDDLNNLGMMSEDEE